MEFEWDENKNQINIRKHEIDFLDASKVFDDPNFIVNEDTRHDYDEARYQVIGNINAHGTIFVVHTERYDNVIRIISARKANNKEKHLYQSR